MKPFPLKLRTKQGCPLSSLLFIPSQSNKTGERNKGVQIGKEEVKLSLFVDYMILYLKDSKNSSKKSLHSHKHIQYSDRIQNQYTKISCISMYNEQSEKEIRKTIHSQ
jgi:hypothetical protein